MTMTEYVLNGPDQRAARDAPCTFTKITRLLDLEHDSAPGELFRVNMMAAGNLLRILKSESGYTTLQVVALLGTERHSNTPENTGVNAIQNNPGSFKHLRLSFFSQNTNNPHPFNVESSQI